MGTDDPPRRTPPRTRSVPPPLHERIRRRRRAQGMLSGELAEKAGVSPSYVSLIEAGVKIPSEEVATAIARALGDDPALYVAWAHSHRFSDPRMTSLGMRRLARLYSTGEDAAATTEDEASDDRWKDIPVGEALHPGEDDDVPLMLAAELEHRSLVRSPDLVVHEGAASRSVLVRLLTQGGDPDDPASMVSPLVLDAGLFGIRRPADPFAYKLGPGAAPRVREYREGDVIVLTREILAAKPPRVFAVRLKGDVVLTRILPKPGKLLLLPGDEKTDYEVLDFEGGPGLEKLIAGTVVLEIGRAG